MKLATLDVEGRRTAATEMETWSYVPAVPEAQSPSKYRGCSVAVQRPGGHVQMDCLLEQSKVAEQDYKISQPSSRQMEIQVVLELSLGSFGLLAPRVRCKREGSSADVSREK